MGTSFSSSCDDIFHSKVVKCFTCHMKEGECKETYIKWKQCVEEGEKNDKDIVNKCFQVTSDLRKCMEANQDHYGEFLQAEKSTGIKLNVVFETYGSF
ncbi:GCK [Artemisia annua]|uniref:GCK n=1 Tax=Artemisia annua TaxID=35608 RepID=A0A2U1LK03_ARTAN|nr:GCK [Artemisia annua]